MAPNEHPAGDGLVELSDFAHERRRIATQASQRALPAFVEHVDYSVVVCTFAPPRLAIPLAQIDPQKLAARIHELYGAELMPPNVTPLMTTHSKTEILKIVEMSEQDALRAVLRGPEPSLTFERGKFPLRHDFVAINSIEVSFDAIEVSVGGPTEVAEAIATETMEVLWSAAGVNKRWEELSKWLESTAYGTSTRVSLGFKVEELLSPKLWHFVQDEVVSGKKYAGYMGYQVQGDNLRKSDQISAMAAVDELHIAVITFDSSTGQRQQNIVKFSVMKGAHFGQGRVRIISTMNSDKHVEFLTDLIEKAQPINT